MKKIISFDFDNTLSKKNVQEYVEKLDRDKFDIIVVTTRYQDCNNYIRKDEDCHSELFKISKKLKINKIYFTNFENKWKTLIKIPNVLIHLDDDFIELNEINKYCAAKGISVNSTNWQHKINKIIKDDKKDSSH